MKIEKMKTQDLAFAHAQAGMGGVRFKGVKSGRAFWKTPDISGGNKVREKSQVTSAGIQRLMKLTGGR